MTQYFLQGQVYAELCQIVEEWLANMKADGKPLPAATVGLGFVEKIG
jgi:hypothetical protein